MQPAHDVAAHLLFLQIDEEVDRWVDAQIIKHEENKWGSKLSTVRAGAAPMRALAATTRVVVAARCLPAVGLCRREARSSPHPACVQTLCTSGP